MKNSCVHLTPKTQSAQSFSTFVVFRKSSEHRMFPSHVYDTLTCHVHPHILFHKSATGHPTKHEGKVFSPLKSSEDGHHPFFLGLAQELAMTWNQK
jgi:hypothetical protein